MCEVKESENRIGQREAVCSAGLTLVIGEGERNWVERALDCGARLRKYLPNSREL